MLIVDDDESILEFVSLALSQEGYEVSTARHGAAALGRVRQSPPDVILLDMRMPVMDGWSFARAYRRLEGPHAPIIAVTAAVDAAASAIEIHADAFLAKPFDLDQLFHLVAQYTNHA